MVVSGIRGAQEVKRGLKREGGGSREGGGVQEGKRQQCFWRGVVGELRGYYCVAREGLRGKVAFEIGSEAVAKHVLGRGRQGQRPNEGRGVAGSGHLRPWRSWLRLWLLSG